MASIRPHHVAIAGVALAAATLAAHIGVGARPAHCAIHGQLPDSTCTPGAINQNVTQANIQTTICVQGFTKTIRPPVSYTNPLKMRLMAEYGQTNASSKDS